MAVLGFPHARLAFGAATLARLCYGLQGLALLFSLRTAPAALPAAALAVALFGLATALGIPVRARLAQRHRAALPLLAGAYALSLGAIAAASGARLPAGAAIALAVVAGLFPPPVGPTMRALWGRICPGPAYAQRALSLDTAAESAAFALGPAAAGFLIPVLGAPVLLGACAGLILAGCLLLTWATAQAADQASPAPGRPARGDATAGSPAAGGPPAHGGEDSARRDPGAVAGSTGSESAGERLPFRFLLVPLMLTVAVSIAVNAAEIASVGAWGVTVTGVALALFSGGGVAGGLAYGGRTWRLPLARRPALLAAGAAACYALPAVLFAPPAAWAALLAAGACTDILLVATYQLVHARVDQQRQAEAGAWLNTAFNLGAAAGTAAGGLVTGESGPRACLAVVAVLLATCAAGPAGLALSAGRPGGRPGR
ncbi:MAG TPA: hypothetical protein VH478_21370 [Trebonia sp.]|jgi:predicted MFS family arabinose efflux permease|nr:hypothetical protein [Trebonia sp.]